MILQETGSLLKGPGRKGFVAGRVVKGVSVRSAAIGNIDK
jgi:hypothetical protein